MAEHLPSSIPDWIPPLDTGQPTAGALDDLSLLRKQTFAARNTIIPIPYGRDRIFGQPFVVHVDEDLGFLYVAYSFGQGEITGYETVYIDAEDKLALGTAYIGMKNRGFENGDDAGWDAETLQDGTVNATVARTGTYSMNMVSASSASRTQQANRLLAPPEGTTISLRGWAQRNATPTSLPTDGCRIVVYDTTTIGGALTVNTTDKVTVLQADEAVAGWQEILTTYTVPAGIAEFAIALRTPDLGSGVGSWDFDDISTEILESENSSTLTVDAIEIVVYRGEPTQPIDSLLDSVLTGYVDTLPDTAYIVLRVAVGSTRGFPRLEAILHGRRVYDPRLDDTQTTITPAGSGDHRVGDPSTWVFSTNPAICFRDVIENFTGWDILDQGIVDLADYNDELIGGVKRREIGLTLNKPSKVEDWVKGFRTYMGAFLAWEGGKIRVIPNRADVEAQGGVVCDGSAGTWVNMGDQAELDMDATQDFTVEVSFKTAVIGTSQAIFTKKNNAGDTTVGYSIHVNNNNDLVCRVSDGTTSGSDTATGVTVNDDEWHTVSMVIDQTAEDMTVTIDNVARTAVSISAVTGTLVNTEPFRIGAQGNGGRLWDGSIDEVRVWDDIRTTQELSDNVGQEISDPTSEANLVGYWKLNEATSDTTAVDSSSSGNDGTLAGAALFGLGSQQVIPDGVAVHIGVDDIVKDSLSLSRRSLRSVPNSVAIDYEDGSGAKWHTERVQSDSPRVVSGAEARRLSRISLPGIHNASQAQREAIERLNWYLTDLEATVSLFDEGWQLQHGSIVAMTHPIGLDAKLFRVKRTTALSGRWVIDLVEYDPAVYSDEVVADPTTPDTNLGNPLSPPTIQNLSLAEELFTYKNGLTGSRIRATWTATQYPFLSQYLVEGYVDGTRVWQQFTQANDVVTPPVEELVDDVEVTYEVRVYIQSPFAQGDVVTKTVQVEGKLAEPGDVPFINLTVVAVDQVDITWGEAVDIDIWRYELRVGDPITNNTWALATKIDLVDGLQYSATNLAIGAHRFFVKARDSVGNESLAAVNADVTLSKPTAVLILTGFEVASEVRLNWPAVVSGFVERYRISYDTYPTPTTEITLDTVDTLRFQTKDVPEGTFEFSVWAQDKNGIEAETAATIVIEVTSDADAFLADTYNFGVSPSLTNVVSYTLRTDLRTFYVTNMGDSFAVSPTDFVAADPLANYHSVGASEWLSEPHDFGLLLTGSWNLTHDTTALQGNILVELELSAEDNGTPSAGSFIKFTSAAKGIFRHAQVRISTSNPPGTATTYVKTPLMNLKINVVPLEESGEAVSTASAGVGKTIILSREYTALKEIMAQPKNTIASGSAVTAIVDNIIIGSNTATLGDGTNYLDGGDILDMISSIDFSVECFARRSNQSGDLIIVGKKSSIASGNGWTVYQTNVNNTVGFKFLSGSNVNHFAATDSFPLDGLYHHIAFTFDQGTNDMIIYIDGVKDGATRNVALGGGLENGVNFRTHANGAGGEIWSGEIDELRIWDDIRNAGEIADNFQSEVSASSANLVGYWKMDGPTGGSVTTVQDESTNNNDLTDTGGGDLIYVDPGNAGNLIQKLNSFDVFIFDTFGQQLSEEFQWKWKAV